MDNKQALLTEELIKASEDYYNHGQSSMSDLEFDKKVEELKQLEQESGIVLPNSPTQNVGAKVEGLKLVKHEYPALSLDKVKYKDREDLIDWLGDKAGILSWKLDGSTIVLTYDNGKLTSAVTRGQDGIEGGDITHNARYFKGVPTSIAYKEHLIVRGEAMMSNAEFERLKEEAGGKYENARNLGTATVQMLDPEESRKREIIFKAFKLVYPIAAEGLTLEAPKNDYKTLYDGQMEYERFDWLKALGFGVVDYEFVNSSDILEHIDCAEEKLSKLEYPTDGLVISYVDQVYADSLGMTGHHPRGSIAMKWPDEVKDTTLTGVEWSVGKTGLITPVAIFGTVHLGLGSDVRRASMHNLSIMKKLNPHIGGKVGVYLANLIIPQIEHAYGDGADIEIPKTCPICHGAATVETDEKSGVMTLHCNNSDCPARVRGALENTFSKSGIFVKGLGPSQIADLQTVGMLTKYPLQIFRLRADIDGSGSAAVAYKNLMDKDGWGKKSWNNLLDAIDDARHTDLQHFLYALNIPLLGNDLSKKLSKYWNKDIHDFQKFVYDESMQTEEDIIAALTAIDGVGQEKASNIAHWIMQVRTDEISSFQFKELINELIFEAPAAESEQTLAGMTFVITGAVYDYKNRDEFKESVERRGGKVSGSVSAKTNFLVNNDVTSTSGKNQKAKELGIEIISEADFIARFGR